MSVLRWAELDRRTLSHIVPEALIIIPMGSVEQHGDHLPTGTDYLLASDVAAAAAERAAATLTSNIVLTPELTLGASDHHLRFGGTLSLSPQTLLAVLGDVLGSAASAGARRIVLLNGHGGNTGICHAAAAASSVKDGVTVAHIDYWKVLPEGAGIQGAPLPGHAGMFETSMILANHPKLVRDRPERPEPPSRTAPRGVEVHSARHWADMDGFSDHPDRATAEEGRRLTEALVGSLSAALIELAGAP